MLLHRLSIGSSDDDSDGGGSIHMGNNRIHTEDSSDTHSSGSRPQFPLTPAR